MRCEDFRSLLDMYMEGELAEETTKRLERHLLRCPTCTYELRTLEQTRAMLREAIPSEETSPAFRERATARLLNAFASHLRVPLETEDTRQWRLPLG